MGEGSVAPSLPSLTPELGESLWEIQLCCPGTFLAGLTSVTQGVCSHQPHGPEFCPSATQCGWSAAWRCSACCSFPSALFFFHLFLLCLIAFGFVSARCVCTDFLFSSFIWLEFNYTLGTEIPDSKYCLFAFSSIYTETWDIFLGEHFSFFPQEINT